MSIDVSVLKFGDQYRSNAEGWVHVDFVENVGGIWRVWDDGEYIQVTLNGKHVDGSDDWDIVEVELVE